ncbi:MAG: hypothetical protein ACLQU5_11860 [Isosphaeraceae bacterium]
MVDYETAASSTQTESDKQVTSIQPPGFPETPHQRQFMPPDLAAIVDAWPNLPEPLKAGILAMVRVAGKGGAR